MAHTDVHPNTFRANAAGWPTHYWLDVHEDDDSFASASIHLGTAPSCVEVRLRLLEQAIADVRAMLPQEEVAA